MTTLRGNVVKWLPIVLCLSLTAFASSEDAIAGEYQTVLREVAKDLSSTLSCEKTAPLQIGVLPIEPDEIEVAKSDADQVYELFVSELISVSQGCFGVIDARAAFQTLEYIGKVGAFGDKAKFQLGRIRQSLSSVNLVAQIEISPAPNGSYTFILKLTNFDTGVAVFRAVREFNLQRQISGCAGLLLAPQVAFEETIKIIEKVTAGSPVIFEGVYHENTNVRTELALSIGRQMYLSAEKFGGGVQFRENSDSETRSAPFDGISLSRIKEAINSPNDYLRESPKSVPNLVVRYGYCEEKESNIWIKTFLDKKLLSEFVVGDASFTKDAKEVNGNFDQLKSYNDSQSFRSFGLNMSSNFGVNPALQVGDILEISVKTEKDAWLYCFYLQSDGVGIQLYPNKFNRPGQSGFLVGGRTLDIPNRLDPDFPDKFDLQITDDSLGIEVISCYAVADNLNNSLPDFMLGQSFSPITSENMSKVHDILNNTSAYPVEKQSLTLSVFPGGTLKRPMK